MHKRMLPHGDYDYMGEAINLVNNFKVEKVIFNCVFFSDLENELIKVLEKKKISYYFQINKKDIVRNPKNTRIFNILIIGNNNRTIS